MRGKIDVFGEFACLLTPGVRKLANSGQPLIVLELQFARTPAHFALAANTGTARFSPDGTLFRPATVTRPSLDASQFKTVGIIESLNLGGIQRLTVQGCRPVSSSYLTCVLEVEIWGDAELAACSIGRLNLESDFARLFAQMGQMREGSVVIEARRHLPFKRTIARVREVPR